MDLDRDLGSITPAKRELPSGDRSLTPLQWDGRALAVSPCGGQIEPCHPDERLAGIPRQRRRRLIGRDVAALLVGDERGLGASLEGSLIELR